MGLYDVSTSEKKTNPELVAGGTLYADSPIGTILPYGGASAPSGWFLCQGQALSRTTYSELFAVIGTSFGVGDGSTTFNLPDMRESVPKGAGLTGKTVGAHLDADGLAVGEFLDDRVQTHTHLMGVTQSSLANGESYSKAVINVATQPLTTMENSGRKGATTEVKSVGVNYIIKAKMVAVPADFVQSMGEFEKYSTDEVLTNKTWIDGKPIYRKCFYSATNWSHNTSIGNIENIDTVINIISTSQYSNGRWYTNYQSGSTRNDAEVGVNGDVTANRGEGFVNNLKALVIIEYTKTTD